MADDSLTIELSMSELREVAGYATACARPALAIFERERPDDPRPRAAIDAAQAFADGAKRTKEIRDCAWAAQRATPEAREAGSARGRTGCGERRCPCCRRRGRCGVPSSAGKSDAGQAHPRIGRARRASVRTRGWRRSGCGSRPHRAGAGTRESRRAGGLEAISRRPGWRWSGRRTDSPAGRIAPVINLAESESRPRVADS